MEQKIISKEDIPLKETEEKEPEVVFLENETQINNYKEDLKNKNTKEIIVDFADGKLKEDLTTNLSDLFTRLQNIQIIRLEFFNTSLKDDIIKKLIDSLEQNQNLAKSLKKIYWNLGENKLTSKSLLLLLKLVQNFENLSSFHLDYSENESRDSQIETQELKNLKWLRLDFERSNLNTSSLKVINQFLKGCKNLQTLTFNFSDSKMPKELLKILDSLADLENLSRLEINLRNCQIRNEFFISFFTKFKTFCQKLEYFRIILDENEDINDDSVKSCLLNEKNELLIELSQKKKIQLRDTGVSYSICSKIR